MNGQTGKETGKGRQEGDNMAERKKIYIWGTGKNGRKVLEAVNTENCQVAGFIDNDPAKQGKSFEGIEIVAFKDISEDYAAIIVSVIQYYAVLYQLKSKPDVDCSKIIVFLEDTYCDNPEYDQILDRQKWRIALLEHKVEKLETNLSARIENAGYEIIDRYLKGGYRYPRMGSTEEAVDKIVNQGCSLVRYGDGEFEIMAGKERSVFQSYSPELAGRLSEVIASQNEKLLIAIANNYGNLDVYTEDSADGIRLYMNDEVRKFHMSVLEKDRVYYDAYMFKSYFPYKNREDTGKRVMLVKRIWEQRDVVIVEGDKTRAGYGNDLFANARSLRRILCPTSNVFDKYEKVLDAVSKVEKNCLMLIVLGAVSNLLVYDLMQKGYQAIDIGQIDMDYEWYRVGAEKRVPIPDRYVSQLPPAEISAVNDKEYLDQVIERIS